MVLMFLSIIATILILGAMIFVHELGHFAASKYFKIPVKEFAIGMGPKIKSFKRGETEYSLRAIPIGGFVDIEGIEVGSDSENGFNTKKPYQRFIVLVAGVFMNFIMAYVIAVSLFLINGENIPDERSIVGNVSEISNAYGVLKAGDIIVSVDGNPVSKWSEMVKQVGKHDVSKPVVLSVKRGEVIENKEILLTYNKESKKYIIGVIGKWNSVKYGFGGSLKRGGEAFIDMAFLVFKGFKMVATNEVSVREMKGPVGLVGIVMMFIKMGVAPLFYLAAILSVNVGIFNLLPFPGLDGGRIIFIIFEKLGIKVDKKREENMHKFGIIVLLGLMLLITMNDIWTIFN